MNVATLYRKDVITVTEGEDLRAAARLMREHHVGFLVVVAAIAPAEAQVPVGVLTDRDIVVKVVAQQIDPATLTVRDVMTRYPVVAAEGEAIPSALAAMRRVGVRRLPVVGAGGQLKGVIAIDDVLESLAKQLGSVAASIRLEQSIEGMRLS